MQDNEFIRGTLPMTKSEVRAVSLSKLALTPDAVFWDIGAGTGSVAVEAARQLAQMSRKKKKTGEPAEIDASSCVYAIERNQEGISLIEKNRKKLVPEYTPFFTVQGTAPEALAHLPAPTHVFIGGSGGKLHRIVRHIFTRNPRARLVVNVVTAESLALCIQLTRDFPLSMYEIVQVAVTRLEPVGGYHMQKAQNPVYVALLQGRENNGD